MKFEELMYKLQYLTVQEVENQRLEIEHLSRLSPTLHLDNYLTYLIFLEYRQDLPEEEKELYYRIAQALKQKEDEEYQEALKRFDNNQ
jgi:hypothetical protein